jgi:hypothetical protein
MARIIVELTEKEKELLCLFKTHGSLSAADNFKGWGDSDEWNELRSHRLIYHCNHSNAGSYIRYALTELGEQAYDQINAG